MHFRTKTSPLEEEVEDFPWGPDAELPEPELFWDGPVWVSVMGLSNEPLPRPRPVSLARPDDPVPEDEDEL